MKAKRELATTSTLDRLIAQHRASGLLTADELEEYKAVQLADRRRAHAAKLAKLNEDFFAQIL